LKKSDDRLERCVTEHQPADSSSAAAGKIPRQGGKGVVSADFQHASTLCKENKFAHIPRRAARMPPAFDMKLERL